MHPEHRSLLEQLHGARRPAAHGRFDPSGYLGLDHPYLNVSVPDRRRIAKAWLAAHRSWPAEDVLALADSLVLGASHEEKTLATLLVANAPAVRARLVPAGVERWLDHLGGWAEVDSLCQNVFTAEELFADWAAWKDLIRRLAVDGNINKRRAALVLLTGTVARSDDERLVELAFEILERLKGERAILITKATSWLLRSLIPRRRDALTRYLRAQASTLPAIAVRETRRKLETGRK
jgi:3-methyladenine DNA glycosylase AlkD